MSEIKGTNVASPIVPFTTEDNYPTHYALYGKGGLRTVSTIDERNSIPVQRLELGMFVYVIDVNTLYKLKYEPTDGRELSDCWEIFHEGGSATSDVRQVATEEERLAITDLKSGLLCFVIGTQLLYMYIDSTIGWVVMNQHFDPEVGIPMLTDDMADTLESQGKLPDVYVHFSDKDEVTEETISVPSDRTYIATLFSAIRKLEAEVAKLRNSFKYGINSYNGKDTAMSSVVNDYSEQEVEPEEPLWAVDESDLSAIESATISMDGFNSLHTEEGSTITVANKSLVINGTAYYDDTLTQQSENGGYKLTSDPKTFTYITTKQLDNANSLATDMDVRFRNRSNLSDMFSVSIKDLVDSSPIKTNVQIIVSCKKKVTEETPIAEQWANTVNYREGIVVFYNEKYYQSLAGNNINHVPTDIAWWSEYEFGENFIWIGITEYLTNNVFAEGYLTFVNDSIQLSDSKVVLENKYFVDRIEFNNLTLCKCNAYSKYADFSHEVLPYAPTDENEKYGVAHLTIRSVENHSVLMEIQNQLPKNELIWEDTEKKLYIKADTGVIEIGTSGGGGDTMTREQVIEILNENGIIFTDGDGQMQLSNISDITFIAQDTNEKFNVSMDAYGNLVSKRFNKEADTLKKRIAEAGITNLSNTYYRGLLGRIGKYERSRVSPSTTASNDLKLNTDRLKIGAFYAPLANDKVFGCTHGYIELENTSDRDIALDDIYLIYAYGKNKPEFTFEEEYLPLTGTIKAGGTYLIRCKQYSTMDDSNTFIDVDKYDQEWYVKNGNSSELIDLTIEDGYSYGFALVYHIPGQNVTDIKASTQIVADHKNETAGQVPYSDGETITFDTGGTFRCEYKPYYLDSTTFASSSANNKIIYGTDNVSTWVPADGGATVLSNCIVKNTFELDPAKQAFQACTTKESSRIRNTNISNDYQFVQLKDKYISFPFSEDVYDVASFKPKASFENKNVCTDKTKLNKEKPNMVTCSFGINMYTTRCFNWISAGMYDEYVFIKNSENDSVTWTKFASYTDITEKKTQSETYPNRQEFSVLANNTIYSKIVGRFPADNTQFTAHKCILNLVANAVETPTTYTYVVGRADKLGNPDFAHCSEEYTFTLYPNTYTPKIYQVSDQQGFHWIEYQVWNAAANKLEEHIEYDTANSTIIPVLINTGDMTQNGTRINEWLDYYNAGVNLFKKYEQMNVVGNNDLCGSTDPYILGTGDDEGKSNSFYFHLFYCYEVNESTVTVNDEEVARYPLPIFKSFEGEYKYIPSLYYFECDKYRFVMVNSEITEANSKNWFKLVDASSGEWVNPYTGWKTTTSGANYFTSSDFVSIYTMIYKMLLDSQTINKDIITVCHEMPFTVITNSSLSNDGTVMSNQRSFNGKTTSLVGSHTNQISSNDKGFGWYWFSRLMEYTNKVKQTDTNDSGCLSLCIGGHKHTYMATYPVREFFYFRKEEGGTLYNSRDNYSEYAMSDTLANDNLTYWTKKEAYNDANYSDKALSKFPLIGIEEYSKPVDSGHFYPYTPKYYLKTLHPSESYTWEIDDIVKYTDGHYYKAVKNNIVLNNTTIAKTGDEKEWDDLGTTAPSFSYGITYFMCQATGYKLTSNKELPSTNQKFGYIIPKTQHEASGDKASNDQKYPIYITIDLKDYNDYDIFLLSVDNIMSSGKFTQQTYAKAAGGPVLKYYKTSEDWLHIVIPAWNSTTEFDKDAIVYYESKYYKSKVNNNQGNTPVGGESDEYWEETELETKPWKVYAFGETYTPTYTIPFEYAV